MLNEVIDLKVKEHLSLEVSFKDGVSGSVKFEPEFLEGVFEPLKEPDFFSQAYIECGVVTWPGEIDIAPDAMHKELQQRGYWILKDS